MSNISRQERRAKARRLAKQLAQGDSAEPFGASPSIMDRSRAWPDMVDYEETSGSSGTHPGDVDAVQGVSRSGWDARLAKTSDIAAMLVVHPKTVERWRRLEGLPCLKVRGTVRYDVTAVIRWLSEKSREARS